MTLQCKCSMCVIPYNMLYLCALSHNKIIISYVVTVVYCSHNVLGFSGNPYIPYISAVNMIIDKFLVIKSVCILWQK